MGKHAALSSGFAVTASDESPLLKSCRKAKSKTRKRVSSPLSDDDAVVAPENKSGSFALRSCQNKSKGTKRSLSSSGDGENKSDSFAIRSCQNKSKRSKRASSSSGDGENKSECSLVSSPNKLSSYKHSNHFFPSPYTPFSCLPHSFKKDDKDDDSATYSTLNQLFNQEVPQYPDHHDIQHRKKDPKLTQGSHVKLKSLLTNKKQKRDFLVTKNNTQVDVTSLRGKYVLICCFFVPVLRECSEDIDICLTMGALYSELHERQGLDNFEMVMVAKMRSDWDCETVFDHFFSGFHDKCLAIPYSDSQSRDYVAKTLGLRSKTVAALVLSPSGEVLQQGYPDFLVNYGAASFPFSDVHFADLDKQDEILKCRLDAIHNEQLGRSCSLYQDPFSPLSLQELLQCGTLSKICDERARVSVSDLNKKVVGLYLCESGDFMGNLVDLQKKCIKKGLEFEIVLVCLAFYNDQQSYMSHVKLAAKEYDISSWWVLPFSDKVCRTLGRISDCDDDQLIMLPPPGSEYKSGDVCGKAIASLFGTEAYPFTKEAIIAKREAVLKSYTLQSLLQEIEYVVQKNGGSEIRVPVSDLKDKKVILYIDHFDCEKNLYRLLSKCYSAIQAHHPGTEVIFVPLDSCTKGSKGGRSDKMPWLMWPSKVSSKSLLNKLFLVGVDPEACDGYPTLMTFGKDGRILSRDADTRLRKVSSLFRYKLRSELITALEDTLECED